MPLVPHLLMISSMMFILAAVAQGGEDEKAFSFELDPLTRKPVDQAAVDRQLLQSVNVGTADEVKELLHAWGADANVRALEQQGGTEKPLHAAAKRKEKTRYDTILPHQADEDSISDILRKCSVCTAAVAGADLFRSDGISQS